jgi:hypothetical protein
MSKASVRQLRVWRRGFKENVGYTVLAADLALGDDKLEGVSIVGVVEWVVEDADRFEQVVRDLRFAGEVRRVRDDGLAFCAELHAVARLAALFHRRLNTDGLAAFPEHFVDVCVEHVCAAVNGGEASKALGQFAEAVERVDVRRFAVAGHAVDVQTDAHDDLFGDANLRDILVGGVQRHGVSDEVARVRFQAVFVVNFLHGALVEVQACPMVSLHI